MAPCTPTAPSSYATAVERIRADPYLYSLLPLRWRANRDVALLACRLRGLNLVHVPGALAGARAVVLAAVRSNGNMLAVTPRFQDDPTIVSEAVHQTGMALQFASLALRCHRPIVLAAVRRVPLAYLHAAPGLKSDREIVLCALQHPYYPLSCILVPPALRCERGVLLAMLASGGEWPDLMEDVFPAWRDDSEVVHAVLRREPLALRHASARLKADRPTISFALSRVDRRKVYELFSMVPPALRAHREVLCAFVHLSGWCLELAPTSLRHDPRLARLAVAVDPGYLRYSPLRGDREVVLAAVRGKGTVIRHATSRMRADLDVVLSALSRSGAAALAHIGDGVFRRRCDVVRLLEGHPHALARAPDALRDDRALVAEVVRRSGCCLAHASAGLRADRRVVLAAVRSSGEALQFASVGLRDDDEVVRAAVDTSPWALRHASPRLCDDAEVVLAAVAANGDVIQFVSERLRDHPATLVCAMRTFPEALRHARASRDDRRVVLACAQRDVAVALQCASPRLRADSNFLLLVHWIGEGGGAFAARRIAEEETARHLEAIDTLAAVASICPPEALTEVEAIVAALSSPAGLVHRADARAYATEAFAHVTT